MMMMLVALEPLMNAISHDLELMYNTSKILKAQVYTVMQDFCLPRVSRMGEGLQGLCLDPPPTVYEDPSTHY